MRVVYIMPRRSGWLAGMCLVLAMLACVGGCGPLQALLQPMHTNLTEPAAQWPRPTGSPSPSSAG
jgi:hypothetical protein